LEFKKSLRLKEEICRAVSAFSNANGGSILVGLSNDGKVIGVDIGRNTLEELANYIKRNSDPAIFPSVKVLDAEGKKIIVIEVKESAEKPVFFKNHAYKRVGKTNQMISSSELRKLAKESGAKVYWDEQICKEASLKDISEEKVRWFLKRAKTERNFDVDPDTPLEESLEKLKLTKDEKPTNASLLLFGKEPQRFFLQDEVRCARFKGTEAVKPFIDMKVFGGDIIDQVNKALTLF
jgi:ATP-dependent DNA helicase RecG